MTKEQITEWMGYRRPSEQDIEKLNAMRSAATEFALAIVQNTPQSGERVVALHRVKETLMIANAALVAPMPK